MQIDVKACRMRIRNRLPGNRLQEMDATQLVRSNARKCDEFDCRTPGSSNQFDVFTESFEVLIEPTRCSSGSEANQRSLPVADRREHGAQHRCRHSLLFAAGQDFDRGHSGGRFVLTNQDREWNAAAIGVLELVAEALAAEQREIDVEFVFAKFPCHPTGVSERVVVEITMASQTEAGADTS